MFRSKTVFVVGAGASAEAGLPTGNQLRDAIGDALNFQWDDSGHRRGGDRQLQIVLNEAAGKSGIQIDIDLTAKRIQEGLNLSNSIDDFLDVHQGDAALQLCGKIAIISNIMAAESNSTLRNQSGKGPNLGLLQNTWYRELMALLTTRVGRSQVKTIFDNVSFIVFNYDRCVEQFLFWALQRAYGISLGEAYDICMTLKIFHPYGSVGPFLESPVIIPSFGLHGDSFALSRRIRTYTEETQDREQLTSIRTEIGGAHTVVFLGFAFHEQNMALLCPGYETRVARVLATSNGISEYDLPVVRRRIRDTLRSPSLTPEPALLTLPMKCKSFFESLQRTIST